LQQALRSGRVHHAYLFSGPRGCGKTSSARILARSLNCVDGPTPTPCGVCEHCVAIAEGTSLDVVEIDAASHGGVDDARDLRERAFFAPVSARYKLYIVDEAHMVTREGFNALLKVVEEPPPHVKFVFATTEPEKVLATIRSRTHHYPFRLLPPRVLTEHLAGVCARETVEIDPRALALVVRAGAGSARDAMSVLDQLIAGAGPGGVTYDLARALLGVTDVALLDDMVDALGARDGAAVFATIAALVDAGHDPRRFAADLLERLRDLVVVAAVPDAVERGLVDVPEDQAARLVSQASAMGPAALSRAADLLNDGLTEMRGTTSPRLLLEIVCARVLLPGASSDTAATLARVERLERRLEIAGAPPAPAPAAAPARPASTIAPGPVVADAPAAPPANGTAEAAEPARTAAPPPEPARPGTVGEIDAAGVRRVWPEILEAVKRRRQQTRAMLLDATVIAADARSITLEFKHHFHRQALEDGVNRQNVVDALAEVLGGEFLVVATLRGGEDTLPTAPTMPAATVDAFAPGDEPAEPSVDLADGAPRERVGGSGEDAAVALLKAGLGATVISETDR
jgi:DNA polymerase-3 subunit gamma/tau